jgi:hypothetical protein
LIESTVRVTIRHSDNPQIASEAATAWVSPDEATGAEGPTKPAAPGDRIMDEILRWRVESPETSGIFAGIAGNIAAAPGWKMAK